MNFDFSKVGQGSNIPAVEVQTTANVTPINKTNVVMGINDNVLSLSEKEIELRVNDAVKSMNEIVKELNNKYIEREDEIYMLALCVISATNCFMHGPAGTGKSGLTEDFARRIVNANYFRALMGKTTEPGEIFGPVSINAMKQDKYKVNTTGKLPTAHVVFLDEVFKCNSAVLNSLLTVMNEKLFFNDGEQEVPLVTLIGASNEYIEEDSLAALYDRFLCRWHVNYIQDSSNRLALFKGFLDSRKGKSKLQKAALTTVGKTEIDIEDLFLLNEKVKEVDINIKVLKEYNKLFNTLEKKGIVVSDRRKNESLKILQASALLDGRDYVDVSDFMALKYTLWNVESDLSVLVEELSKIASPNDSKYRQYKQVLDDYRRDLEKNEEDKDSPDYAFNRSILITEMAKSLQHAKTTVKSIIDSLPETSKDRTKFGELLNEMQKFENSIKNEIII